MVLVSVTAVALLGSTGVAQAYWKATGSGNGTATVRNGFETFTTTATATSATVLYPGIANAPISIVVNNSANTYALTVTNLAVDPGRSITADAGHAGCTAPAITVASAILSLTVAAGASSAPQTANVLSMGPAAQNACQGATFTIPLVLTGRSN
ncbi:MAG: hypothetical protein ACT4QG_17490 [Sporichthyaceae bacterium]